MSAELLRLLTLRAACGGRQAAAAAAALLEGGVEAALARCAPTQAQRQQAARQLAAIVHLGLQVVPVWRLPAPLRRLRPLPLALFVRGAAALLTRPAVAIVGSRQATAGALAWATARAQALARRGTLVISGGAAGIDAAAHRGALAAGAATVAYLGCPIDQVYPAANRPLFAQLLRGGGALVSEHPPCTTTCSYHHAARNRFIAAHAARLVVVAAAAASGSLGTARLARRLGCPIEVAPAAVGGARAGIDWLLRLGWAAPADGGAAAV